MLDCGSINALRFPIDIYENGNVFISLAEGKENREKGGRERWGLSNDRSLALGSLQLHNVGGKFACCLLCAVCLFASRLFILHRLARRRLCVCVSVLGVCECVCPLAAKNETQNECRKVRKKRVLVYFRLAVFQLRCRRSCCHSSSSSCCWGVVIVVVARRNDFYVWSHNKK